MGSWDVCWCTKQASQTYDGKRGGYTEHRGLELGYAMRWAEDMIDAEMRAGHGEVSDFGRKGRELAAQGRQLQADRLRAAAGLRRDRRREVGRRVGADRYRDGVRPD